ncbi:MAG: Holliday junction branch migration protein RuvA [Patescibacteria group bacterium]
MISYLRGKPQVHANKIILEVNGVGYGVFASQKVLVQTAEKEEICLYIYTYVKEDKLELYGFLSFKEQELFELVLSVSGIGPTTALHIMDKNPEQLITAVQEANVSFFKSIPRIGKKMAQKIIIELRGKLGELKELNLGPLSPKQQTVSDALSSLGWDDDSIQQALERLNLDQLSVQEAIKQALQKLS